MFTYSKLGIFKKKKLAKKKGGGGDSPQYLMVKDRCQFSCKKIEV